MKFIVIEGLDGCGKTTQIRLLAAKLEALGIPCFATRQPSDNPVGKLMRTATDGLEPLENETMALLVAADRYQHVFSEVLPALEAGKIVLCDRYYYSSFAFQGIDTGAFLRVAAYNGLVMAYAKPDITIFIDTTPEECMRRIQTGRDYSGLYDSVEQLSAVRERYMAIFDQLKDSENIAIINGNASESEIAAEIFKLLNISIKPQE
jgi:dTMP kinase